MKKTAIALLAVAATGLMAQTSQADNSYQTLPYSQNWSAIALIAVDDNWAGVPGVLAYRGDNLTAAAGVDPQTVLGDDLPGVIDINANKPDPLAFFTGGAAEFELADPVVALTGSGTADAPYLVLHINAGGKQNISVRYTLRDLEIGTVSTDNSIQAVALQFRVGAAGPWTNVPAGFVADASSGPADPPAITNVVATLPAVADNALQLQIRVITANALGNDEWIGVDEIAVVGEDIPTPTEASTWGKIKAGYRN
jgi:hypothetical protein